MNLPKSSRTLNYFLDFLDGHNNFLYVRKKLMKAYNRFNIDIRKPHSINLCSDKAGQYV